MHSHRFHPVLLKTSYGGPGVLPETVLHRMPTFLSRLGKCKDSIFDGNTPLAPQTAKNRLT